MSEDQAAKDAAEALAYAYSPADRVVRVAAALRKLYEENEELKAEQNRQRSTFVGELFDRQRAEIAALKEQLRAEKAMRAKAEFRLEHREWNDEFRTGCTGCAGKKYDPRHTWTDEQWLAAQSEEEVMDSKKKRQVTAMKTRKQIQERIKELMQDRRYPKKKSQIATIQVNAPLALIQIDMQAEVRALKWMLAAEESE